MSKTAKTSPSDAQQSILEGDLTGRIVFVQVLSNRPQNVPGTFRFLKIDASHKCGNDEYALLECVEGELPYLKGQKYHAALRRISPYSWELKSA